ncbi:GntR family transcriptional regulator [Streptomyces hoynatensis]|uniref:GntR family transcriptional regulator n=1 Tax=Streptomyces hoynatensis TaxID=1141874 RepID=A0A3A9Z854_9ACTN|nr:GntR family transcriptional regulator [Streptomyces hoynatensis]RKN44004.1 GntR family transcriptional regulator [Streptomyces hoynatensis]
MREALHRLEGERLVERSGRAVTVRRMTPEEILDIYEVRTTLEGAAARSAATRATALDLMRLKAAQEAMRAQRGGDPWERARLNRRFHQAMWEASHSLTTLDLLERLNSHLFLSAKTMLGVDERWQTVLREHDELIAAIESRDPDAARRIAEHHMLGARDVRMRLFAHDAPTGRAAAS